METLKTDYIKHLTEQRLYFFNKGQYDVVEKINKQIENAML